MCPVPTTSNLPAGSSPRGLGYGARIGDLLVRLAAAPQSRPAEVRSAPLQADVLDTGDTGRFSSEFGKSFERTSFSNGEGLAKGSEPDATDFDAKRYWDSKYLDFDDEGRASLLETTENVEVSANSNLYGVYVGGRLWWSDGSVLHYTDDPHAASPTISTEDPNGGSAADLAGVVALGTTLYTGDDGGLHERPASSGVWSNIDATHDIDRIWTAKGRIIYSAGNVLYEVEDPATPTINPLITLGVGSTWNDVAAAGDFVLACASDGHVYAFTFDGTNFGLSGQSWLEGEEPLAVGESFGLVFFTTGQDILTGGRVGRFYRCSLTSNGVFQDITELRVWGDVDAETLDRGPRFVLAGRDSVFVGVAEAAGEVDLWRYDLPTGGLHRSYVLDEGGVASDMLLVDSVPWVWLGGDGPWRRTDTLAATGYLILPLSDLRTADAKTWTEVTLDIESLSGTFSVDYTSDRAALEDPDSPLWATVATIMDAGDTSLQLVGVKTRYLALKVEWTGDGLLAGAAQRAFPPESEWIVTLPVVVSDQVERPGRRAVPVKGLGKQLYKAVHAKQASAVDLELYDTDEVFRGIVEAVGTPILDTSHRGSPMEVSQVRVRGKLVTAGSSAGGWGTSLWGGALWGD